MKRGSGLSCWSLLAVTVFLATSTRAETRLGIWGDLRYRFELSDDERAELAYRHRLRARLGVRAAFSEFLDTFVQIGTGDAGDPVANEQTLGEAFSSKPIWLTLAYFDWRPSVADAFRLRGGKMATPFLAVGAPNTSSDHLDHSTSSELIWDRDLRPEGINLSFKRRFDGDDISLEPFVHTGVFWLQHRPGESDSWLFGGQAGVEIAFDNPVRLTLGGGYFDFLRIEGRPLLAGVERGFGNSVSRETGAAGQSTTLYARDYNEIELFAQVTVNRRASIHGQFVVNVAAENDNKAWMAGAWIGDHSVFVVRYEFRWVQPDAVFGLFSDSDFLGGGTNGKGNEWGIEFNPIEQMTVEVTYLYNKRDLFHEYKYHSLQLDLNFLF